jgi:hypothetical protein
MFVALFTPERYVHSIKRNKLVRHPFQEGALALEAFERYDLQGVRD